MIVGGRCDATTSHPSRNQPGRNMPVCRYFLESGQCRFGGRCRYSHSGDTLSALPRLQDENRSDFESQWVVPSESRSQLGMDWGRVLYGAEGCRLLVVGDGDLSFSAPVAETTKAKLVASCQESCDLLLSRLVLQEQIIDLKITLFVAGSSAVQCLEYVVIF